MIGLRKILTALLGGRPMVYQGMLFRDRVTNKMVNLYIDRYGRRWMATTLWGWDREPWRGDK